MSDDDDLLAALGERARARDDEPKDEWEKLAMGEPIEQTLDTGGDAERLRALHEPLDELAKERITRAALASVRKPKRSWVPRVAAAGAVLVAAAAAIVLFVRQPVSLPAYSAELSVGAAVTRGDEESARFRPDDTLTIVLRPAERVSAEVGAVAFDGAHPWPARLDVSESGSVRVQGVAGELLDEPGRHELTFVIGPPDSLTSSLDDLPPAARVVRVTVELLEP